MKFSLAGRFALALFASMILGLGMTGCGGGTIGFLWVVGQQYNQIAGFKIDDYTGNLTQIPHQPFTTGGTAPVQIVVKPGGRYVYVLNQGTLPASCTSAATCATPYTGSGVMVFSVGGDGVLTLQQTYTTQGTDSQYMQMDATGTYLYVLDKYNPLHDGNGAITAFTADSSSGRLTLVTDTISCSGGACPTYFEVGSSSALVPGPFMMKTAGSCLYVTNTNSVVPFVIGAAGQLQTSTTSSIITVTAGSTITSITGNGSNINLTDGQGDRLFRYAIGGSCGLAATGGGTIQFGPNSNPAINLVNPSYTLFDNSGKYLYVYGQSNPTGTTGNPYSSITAFNITQTNQTQYIGTYGTGSGPVCGVEDPTSQYIYTSSHNDGNINGNVIDTTTGILSSLTRGSAFGATGQAECLAVSGAVD